MTFTAQTINDVTDYYAPLPYEVLSDTFVSRLQKFWKAELGQLGLDVDPAELTKAFSEDMFLTDIDTIGAEFLLNHQPDYGEGSEGVVMTLGQLAATKANESTVQFTVQPSKVESIGKDSKTGFFKIGLLLNPIEMTYNVEEYADSEDELPEFLASTGHMGGGRHRLSFLLTTCQCVDGWEDLLVRIRPLAFSDEATRALYILISNASRTMNPTEKTVVTTSAQGVDVDDVDALFDAAEKQSTMWSKAAQLVSVNLWEDYMSDTELADATLNTRGKFGQAVLTATKKAIKYYETPLELDENGKRIVNADTNPLVGLLRQRSVFEDYLRAALETFASNFKKLKPLAKSEKGGYNYARNITAIANSIVDALVNDDLIAELQTLADQAAEKKREAAKKREAKKVKNTKAKQEKIVEEVKKIGLDKLRMLMAEAEAEESDSDDDDEEDVETVIVGEDDDDDDDRQDELTPPPAAKQRVRRGRSRKS